MAANRLLPSLETLAGEGDEWGAIPWPSPDRIDQLLNQSERDRQLPKDLADAVAEAGFHKLLLPRQMGGEGRSPHEVLAILEGLGSRSGSLAWIAMIAAQSPVLLSLLPEHVFADIYADGPVRLLASSSAIGGEAVSCQEGWRISGTWPLLSGSAHCDLVLVHARTEDGSTIGAVLPRAEVTLVDDWHALGLRGTSSGSVRLDACIVAKSRSFVRGKAGAPSPGMPLAASISEHFALQMSAIAVGLVRRSVAAVITSSATRPLADGKRRFEEAAVLRAIGLARTAGWIARGALAAAVDRLLRDAASAPATFATARYVVEICSSAIDGLFAVSHSRTLYSNDPVQECLRDIHCIDHHANISPGRLAQYGECLVESSYRPIETVRSLNLAS